MKIAIIGYGRMGKEVEQLAIERGHQISVVIDNEDDWLQKAEQLKEVDVAVEFAVPSVAVQNMYRCFDLGVPLVEGTTGWYTHLDEVKELCEAKGGAMVYASNFSLGVNIFFELNKVLAELMSKQQAYDVQVKEIHHTAKLDAPSGTAIVLADEIIKHRSDKSEWINDVAENKNQLSVLSYRIENTPGTHQVIYSSPIDEIEIKHTAFNRKGLALGAVMAAEWICTQKGFHAVGDMFRSLGIVK